MGKKRNFKGDSQIAVASLTLIVATLFMFCSKDRESRVEDVLFGDGEKVESGTNVLTNESEEKQLGLVESNEVRPIVTVRWPRNWSIVRDRFVVSGIAGVPDGGTVHLKITLDKFKVRKLVLSQSNTNWGVFFSVDSPGKHTLEFEASDSLGRKTNFTYIVRVDTYPPDVYWEMEVGEEANVDEDKGIVGASADDNVVVRVLAKLNTDKKWRVISRGWRKNLKWVYKFKGIKGNHAVLEVKSVDAAGWVSDVLRLGISLWDIFPVVDGVVPQSLSISVDRSGRASVLYGTKMPYALVYARKRTRQWIIENIITGKRVAWHNDLVLTRRGRPHISFYEDYPNYDLMYATKVKGKWKIENVDVDGDCGTYNSIALAEKDVPHIAYRQEKPFPALKHAWKEGNNWQIEVVDKEGDPAWGTDIKIWKGKIFIAYRDGLTGFIKVTVKSGGEWKREVAYRGNASKSFSMAVSPDGVPYIALYDLDRRNLVVIHKRGNRWLKEVVDSRGDVGDFPSITIDNEGRIHLSYYDRTNDKVKYARKDIGKRRWRVEFVSVEGNTGGFSDITVDKDLLVHLVYFRRTDIEGFSVNRIEYAYRGGGWFVRKLK